MLKYLMSVCIGIAALTLPATAQISPTIATFDGTDGLSFPAHPKLDLIDYATIELWVQPGWSDDIQYDPALVSYYSEDGPRYAIVMTRGRDGVGFYSGDEWNVLDYDFSQDKLYHIAFVMLGDVAEVYVDGVLEDFLLASIQDVTASSLNIGTLDGVDMPFIGELAGIRIWSELVEDDDIDGFRNIEISSEEGLQHPDLISLVAASDFSDGQRNIYIPLPEPDPTAIEAILADLEKSQPDADDAAEDTVSD
jgi:hypothetical protein